MTGLRHLALILLLVLTGVTLGHARGQTSVAGQVVLCSGGVIVTVEMPEEGPRQIVCPDMALALLAGTAAEPPPVLAPDRAGAAQPAAHLLRVALAPLIRAQARGPPVRASA